VSGILSEFKTVDKSVADGLDKLSWVDPTKIEQFTDLTYTEVCNITYLLTVAQTRKTGYFPFTEKITEPSMVKGTAPMITREVPLTYRFGQSTELLARTYMQTKVSMGRKSRIETQGVAKSFGGGQFQQQQGLMGRMGGWVRNHT
jgi:hypothetical protein